MEDTELRQRKTSTHVNPEIHTPDAAHTSSSTSREYGPVMQAVRGFLLLGWIIMVCVVSHATQLVGTPMYLMNKDYYYAWMSMTKCSFGLLIITITQWFAPTVVRVSGERACRAEIGLDKNGVLETGFPERLVLISNHQLYSDWLFLWWIAYTAKMHGFIYIILKESLKWIPIIGPGMQFYGFIFMARNWAKDQSRLRYRLQKLNARNDGSVGTMASEGRDPMWLLIFPEGTNLSANTRRKSAAFAEKSGIKDFKHVLLPRSTGLQFCLRELKSSVEWVYDCTVAYEGIPRGQYGQDVFTNRGIYFGGKPPKSVNMHWRRFHMSTIPFSSQEAFEGWVLDRWQEKEALLEHFEQTGRFPADIDTPASSLASSMVKVDGNGVTSEKGSVLTSPWAKSLAGDKAGVPGKEADGRWANGSDLDYLETKVQLASWVEVVSIFIPLAAAALSLNVIWKLLSLFR